MAVTKFSPLLIMIILLSLIFFEKIYAKSKKKYDIKQISQPEISVYYNHFQQDGNHSVSKGGIGTQALTIYNPSVTVFIPIQSNHSITANIGVDIITSASIDDIDYEKSSASYYDYRYHGSLTYNYQPNKSQNKYGITISGSREFDYKSAGFGLSFLRKTKDNRSQYSIQLYSFFDAWYQEIRDGLVYPIDLRTGKELISDPNKYVLTLSFSYSSIINKKMNFSVFTDLSTQMGLNSTPFHLVVFSDASEKIEKLPNFRIRIPVGVRYNYFFYKNMILKFYLRGYWDNFDIISTTFSFELPYKISKVFEISPKYRGIYQIGSSYFNPFGENKITSQYYTSDYDLSTFYANQYSLSIRIAPSIGILNINKFSLQTIDLNIGYYQRTDGLNSFYLTSGLVIKPY